MGSLQEDKTYDAEGLQKGRLPDWTADSPEPWMLEWHVTSKVKRDYNVGSK